MRRGRARAAVVVDSVSISLCCAPRTAVATGIAAAAFYVTQIAAMVVVVVFSWLSSTSS